MFDSLVVLGERFHRNGPWWTSLALCAVIAADLVHASASLFGSHSAQREPQRALPAMRRAQVDAHKIAAAHLFGVSDEPASREPKATTANLKLAGTIATENPNRGVAIIDGGDAHSKVYWAGQDVGGALLRSVYLDHVLLDRKGSLEILALPRLTDRPGALAIASPVPRAAALTAQDSASSDELPTEERSVQLATTTIGGVRGFRIVGGKALEGLRASGLVPADVVTAINGTPVGDQDSAQQSMNEVQSGPLVVTVMRRGHPVDISVGIGD